MLKIRFPEWKRKAVTLSYDDGFITDLRLAELLKKHGMKATFNMNFGLWTDESEKDENRDKTWSKLKLSEMKRIYETGHEIAAHGLTHASFWEITPQEIVYEITECRKRLEHELGTLVRGMAYPNGYKKSEEVLNIVRNCGICYARTTVSTESYTNNFQPADWLELPATCHHDNPRLLELAESFVNTTPVFDQNFVFYLWGHSWEFQAHDNWEVIERFAETVSGKSDVWYVTNIELYDYTTAFRSLQRSADGKIVYNPTNSKVWASSDGKDIAIAPGETVKL